jgi:putative addiction module component (TIGR02574 family)
MLYGVAIGPPTDITSGLTGAALGYPGIAAAEPTGVRLNPLLGAPLDDKMATEKIFGATMATEPLQRLRSEMLALSEAERAELAHDLILSLDEPRDSGVEDAWDREISRRIGEIDAGQAELVDRVEFRRRILKKLESR